MSETANGEPATKILPIGAGKHERRMMQIVLESGYSGPIGILDHRPQTDAEQSLKQNLRGLQQVGNRYVSTAILS